MTTDSSIHSDTDWYPQVAPLYVPVVIDPDTIQFRIGPWAGPVYTVVDSDADGLIQNLIRLIDGTHSFSEILNQFDQSNRQEIERILGQLCDEGVVVDSARRTDDGITGALSFPPNLGEEIKDSRILVVNDGIIGRMVTEDLVLNGASNIGLLERSRSTGQPLLRKDVKETVSILSSNASLHDEVTTAEYVVYAETKPNPSLVNKVNRVTADAEVPWVSGRLHGLDGSIGPTVIPGKTSCYECFRTRYLGNLDMTNYQQFESAAQTWANTPSITMCRVIAGFLSLDFQHLFSDGIGLTTQKLFHFDFFQFSVESNTVLKLPRCPVCGPTNSPLEHQRFLSLERLITEHKS